MVDRQDDKQKEIKDSMKDQLGQATQKPAPDKPSSSIDITINGDNVDLGYGVGNTITINYNISHYPAATIGLGSFIYIGIGGNLATLPKWPDLKQKWRLTTRQIFRKLSTLSLKSRQISRNLNSDQNPPQTQLSRHFQPNPPTSTIPPYIPLNHTREASQTRATRHLFIGCPSFFVQPYTG